MNSSSSITKRERILGGLWGSLVGDALGVPVEFMDRVTVQSDPVKGMRGFGTHQQPPGTWSDDSSLLLCSVDSLLRHEFDTQDIGNLFCAWQREGLWTPHGTVFDAGVTTVNALSRVAMGVRAEVAGGDGQFTNGNGSLMRIIPVSLRFAEYPSDELLGRVHRASAITHRHPRSQMACGFYTLVIRNLLHDQSSADAFANGLRMFRTVYESLPQCAAEFDYFQLLLAGDLAKRPESEIDSSGYVVHTLGASLWCVLTTSSFEQCVLNAVNLGGDTDTTGCVAGGLAGVLYGVNAVPETWIRSLVRYDEIASLFGRFADLILSQM